MAKFHVNPNTGDASPCRAEKGQCPFGSADEHYNTKEEAYAAFEASQETFSVVLKKNGSAPANERQVSSFDAKVESAIKVLQDEFDAAENKAEWIGKKVERVASAQLDLNRSLPGTAERSEALVARTKAREDLLAADLVVWRSSEYYNENVEARMKENAIAISDADSAIETALADASGKREVASRFGISENDVENILEIAHRDYLRPRQALSAPLRSLSNNETFAKDTAYVFRVDTDTVRGVLEYASGFSKVEPKARSLDSF